VRNKGKVMIGTSNVVIPGNKKTFPLEFQGKSRLHYYSHHFNTVEINSSFYKIPLLSTYEKWCREVSDDFQFSLKLSKEVTHQKNLPNNFAIMKKFMKSARGIVGKKRGCLLVQFPGKITFDYFNKVEQILKKLTSEDSASEWKKAVEFRNNSWYVGETWDMLNYFGITAVLHDMPKAKIIESYDAAPFIYLRLHGPAGDYRGDYSNSFLKAIASSIKNWTAHNKDVYVYFNNTLGCAFDNAQFLKSLFDM